MKLLIFAFLSLAACCYAQEKMTFSLNDGGYSASGGSGRTEQIMVEIRRGFGLDPISMDEKTTALKEKLHFYELAKQHKVDLEKKITTVYADKPLKAILADLLPGVPVKFDGVDSGVTVESMAIAKTSIETVCDHLDAAAGVYFHFTDQGITVVAKPATK